MTKRRAKPVCSAWLLAAAGSLTLAAVGCGGANFGSELSAKPKPQALGRTEGKTLRLPQDEPFSIHLNRSQQQAGLDGTAEADARAKREGQGAVSARVTSGGQASATFQLGHAFANDGDRQVDLNVAVSCEYEYEAGADPATPWPDATVGLKLYARDGRNRLLNSFSLVQHSTKQGAASSRDRKELRFTLTLGPGESVNVFLAGQVAIEVEAGRSAHGSLKLSGLQMEVETRPAPPVRTAGDEQG